MHIAFPGSAPVQPSLTVLSYPRVLKSPPDFTKARKIEGDVVMRRILALAREKLAHGRLPKESCQSVNTEPGIGSVCTVCDLPIPRSEVHASCTLRVCAVRVFHRPCLKDCTR